MSVRLPNGATLAIAASYGPVKQMTAVTNANPGVATLEASHGVILGDIMEVTSGWAQLNSRIVKAGTVTTNDVQLSGIDTTSTTVYPAGSGTGSIREVATWQQIVQVTDVTTQGGDQQFATYSFLESSDQFQIPTTRSPQSLQFSVGDDTTLPHYAVLQTANNDRLPRALRVSLPGGSVIYYNAYITLNETPSLTKDQIMTFSVTASLLARPVRY
jgi:hypothetical protein